MYRRATPTTTVAHAKASPTTTAAHHKAAPKKHDDHGLAAGGAGPLVATAHAVRDAPVGRRPRPTEPAIEPREQHGPEPLGGGAEVAAILDRS